MKYLVPLVVLGLVLLAMASGPARPYLGAAAAIGGDDSTKAVKTVSSSQAQNAKDKAPSSADQDKGIGPVKALKLEAISDSLAASGQQIFAKKCTVCHQLDSKKVGPPLRNVAKEQAPEFIMNMILNSDEMEKKDPYIKKLVAQYQTYMSGLDLNKDQARAVFEYLRSEAEKGKPK